MFDLLEAGFETLVTDLADVAAPIGERVGSALQHTRGVPGVVFDQVISRVG